MSQPMKIDREWHLNRELSLSTVVMFAIQTSSIIWFIATLNNRVDQFEKQANSFQPQTEKIIRLETKIEAIQDGIAEIKGILRSPVGLTGKRSEAGVK